MAPKKEEHAPTEDNVIRVTAARGQRVYISYAIKMLEGEHESVVVQGMGVAVFNAVNIAEVVKRRIAGLHQTTEIGSVTKTDQVKGKEGKDTVERKLSTITIVLSKKALDTKHVGYQAPIDASEVTPQQDRPRPAKKEEEAPRGRGRGAARGGERGGRGGDAPRGRGEGRGRGGDAPRGRGGDAPRGRGGERGGRGGERGGRGGERGGRGGERGGRGGRGGGRGGGERGRGRGGYRGKQ